MAGWGATRPAGGGYTAPPGAFGPSRPVQNPVGSAPAAPAVGGGNAGVSAALQAFANRPATPIQTIAPPVLSNYAQANPYLAGANTAAQGRYEQLQRGEGRPDPYQQESIENLRKRLSADTTQHAIDRAGNAIKTQAAGNQTALDAMMARRGLGGSGLEARGATGLSEAAQRAQARSATDISLGREAQLDALTLGGAGILNAPSQLGLAQQGLTNQGLGLYQNAAGQLANQGLAQQGLGLQQWSAAQNASMQAQQLQYQQQQQQWAQLMGLLGLTGGFNTGYQG